MLGAGLEKANTIHGVYSLISPSGAQQHSPHGFTHIEPRHLSNMSEARQRLDFDALDDEMAFLPNQHFVLTASTITFREKGQVLLVHNTKYDEGPFWTLPGGRKDIGEALEETAVRETREETGYHVHLPLVSIPTRATRPRGAERRRRSASPLHDCIPTPTASPLAHVSLLADQASTTKDVIDDVGTEPVGVIIYNDPTAEGTCFKFRFLFYATLKDASLPPEPTSLDREERLKAEWVTVADALHKLRFKAERKAVETVAALRMGAALQE